MERRRWDFEENPDPEGAPLPPEDREPSLGRLLAARRAAKKAARKEKRAAREAARAIRPEPAPGKVSVFFIFIVFSSVAVLVFLFHHELKEVFFTPEQAAVEAPARPVVVALPHGHDEFSEVFSRLNTAGEEIKSLRDALRRTLERVQVLEEAAKARPAAQPAPRREAAPAVPAPRPTGPRIP